MNRHSFNCMVVAVGVCLSAASPAAAFTDFFSFTDLVSGQKVGGLVKGLRNGMNVDGAGLTIVVTQAPYADLLDAYTFDLDAGPGLDRYTAANGVITSAELFYATTGGGKQAVLSSTFGPEVVAFSTFHDTYSRDVVVFSAGSATPEAATWAMMVAGFGVVGLALRLPRRRTVHGG